MMTVSPISAVGTSGLNIDQLANLYQSQIQGTSGTDPTSTAGATSAAASRGADFGKLVGSSLQQLEGLDTTAQNKAIQAATGDLSDIQDYVIAATQAQTATELTTTIRNKALDSFNEIMRMSM